MPVFSSCIKNESEFIHIYTQPYGKQVTLWLGELVQLGACQAHSSKTKRTFEIDIFNIQNTREAK